MTLWKFKINGTEVEEPIGWDALEVTLQRDPIFHGLQNIFSDNITFWDTGAQIIREAYETDGIDAQLVFLAQYSCDGGITYNTFISGILNAYFYSITNNEVTIKIEPSGFQRLLKNRLDSQINLNSSVSMDGLPMSSVDPFDLHLHSKEIKYKSTYFANPGVTSISYSSDPNTEHISYPFILNISEVPGSLEADDISNNPPIFYSGFYAPGITKRTINVQGSIKFHVNGQEFTATGKLESKTSSGSSIHVLPIFALSQGSTPVSADHSYTFNDNFDFPQDSYLYFTIEITANGTGSITITFDTTNLVYMNYEELSISAPSITKAFLIHEAFAKISESITGIQDSFRSNFFGRTNSSPHTYSDNGCGSWTAISNGLNIRKMLDKNGSLFPIITSFNDLFNSACSIWNLGMQVEVDNTGKEFIRVEPVEYFYNLSSVLSAVNISNLKQYPSQDLIFNEFKIGYSTWKLNSGGAANGIDELNSIRVYNVPVKLANKSLQAYSKFISSGYLIEETRRLQYTTDPNKDFETDNDLFFICTNTDSVTSDKYTIPAVSTTYAAGTVSERDENFTGITNLISPETSYNLRISPVRMALNWYKNLAPSIWKNPTAAIKFVSGEGNYQEGDTMINDCVISADVIQNQNLLASQLSTGDSLPLYLPEYLEFEYPLSQNDFFNLLANSNKAIQISCSNQVDMIGFLVEVKYAPNADGGTGNFKLLRGRCVSGDFNNDFNSDFATGTC